MERDDLSTGSSTNQRDNNISEQQENIREAAFTRNDDSSLDDTDEINNTGGLTDGENNIKSNSFAASTRFGDEITDSEASVFSGRETDNGSTSASLASSKFGEEFTDDETGRYAGDSTRINTVDDLTDDNDALTDKVNRAGSRAADDNDADKNLWEKIKDKADDIGEGIKKAFD